MAPEQARGEPVDSRADLWAFGPGALRNGQWRAPNLWPSGCASKNLPKWKRIVAKCLENDRELRYQHASEILADLQRLKRDGGSQQSAATAPSPAASSPSR